jgi:hypothetical protein
MNQNELKIKSQITFLYYRDLEPIARFYPEIMGLDLVEDQGWAKIFRVESEEIQMRCFFCEDPSGYASKSNSSSDRTPPRFSIGVRDGGAHLVEIVSQS